MGYGPSRQDRGAGNSGEQPVQFKLADAQRIANVVGQVEGGRRGRKNSTLPRAAGGGGAGIATATFSGNWLKGSEKVLSVSGSTAAVRNISSDILYSGNTRLCFVTMIDGNYVLLTSACE
jgi:hypothetical protein